MWIALSLIPLPALAQQTAPDEDFGQYFLRHQSDLAPFFAKNGTVLLSGAMPLVMAWIAAILFLPFLVGWGIDVLLARGFAHLFAPQLRSFRPAFTYATGRLALRVVLVMLFGGAIIASVGSRHMQALVIALFILFALIDALVQVGWINYLYHTKVNIAVLFFLTLVVVHGFLTLEISGPLAASKASPAAIGFMQGTVIPKIQDETRATNADLAKIAPVRNADFNEMTHLQNQIDQARAEQIEVQNQIESAKNSEGYLYSQIVKVHARGDLTAAHDQLAALLARFPNGALSRTVKSQLDQVTGEIAAQEEQKREAEAAQARAVAHTRAVLLAHTTHGQATLSELRSALLGKSRAEVTALFGPPTETASDRWGYGRPMVFNPLTSEKSGLAIYFSEGQVQSVDYYYGVAR